MRKDYDQLISEKSDYLKHQTIAQNAISQLKSDLYISHQENMRLKAQLNANNFSAGHDSVVNQ